MPFAEVIHPNSYGRKQGGVEPELLPGGLSLRTVLEKPLPYRGDCQHDQTSTTRCLQTCLQVSSLDDVVWFKPLQRCLCPRRSQLRSNVQLHAKYAGQCSCGPAGGSVQYPPAQSASAQSVTGLSATASGPLGFLNVSC
jgi:hypothetical protein